MNIKKYFSGSLKTRITPHNDKGIATTFSMRPPRLTARGDTVVNGTAINNRLSARNDSNIFSGCLKYIVFTAVLGLSVHFTYADDITNTNNYLPNGKYRLFGSGRGEVQNIDNQIRLHSQLSQQAGNLQIETISYQGNLSYEQHFHNHGHRQHSPFSNTAQRNFSAKKGSVVQGGATLTDLSVTGYEIHPADAYDGEQGGGYPVPTGARDEYLYEVTGKEMSVKVVNLNTLPPTAKNDNQLLRQAGIDPERYNQPQSDDRTQIKRLTGSGENTGVYGDLSSNTNGWNAAQIRQPESLRINVGYIAPRVISTPSPYSNNINGNGRIDVYANNVPKTTVSWQPYTGNIKLDKNSRLNVRTAVTEQNYNPSPFSDNINGNGRIDEYAHDIPQIPVSWQPYTGNSNIQFDKNARLNVRFAVPQVIVTPSPFSDNINGNGRIDEYAHDIPQIPVSWQPYTGNSNIQFDKNARLNVRFAVPQVTVTRSPYDRLNVDNSNYGKSTARKNNSDSYPIDIYDDYGDDADFVMGYYYDIGDDEYYYYIVDNYYGNNIIYYDENEDNYLLDVNALNALNEDKNKNKDNSIYLINVPQNEEEHALWEYMIPLYGDYLSFKEAETGLDFLIAGVGVIPTPWTKGAKATAKTVKVTKAVKVKKTDVAGSAAGKVKGSPLPVSKPTKITTKSGETLVYKSNPKHTPGQPGYSPKAGTEPRNSGDIFAQSKPTSDPKTRYAQDTDGNIHRFFNDSKDGTGAWHWSGSTGDKSAPLKLADDLKKELKQMGMNSKVLKK